MRSAEHNFPGWRRRSTRENTVRIEQELSRQADDLRNDSSSERWRQEMPASNHSEAENTGLERAGTDRSVPEMMCESLLREIGEDPAREGLLRTPSRYAKAIREITAGYGQDIETIVNGAIFEESYSEMVLVKDVEFYSLCEHHLLPFFGKAHVAYIPDGKILGLSKIPRIIHMFARRLQVQERLTEEIADAMISILSPLGVACLIEGSHMCMMMRGIQTQGASMVTSTVRGVFREDASTREEFMKLVTLARSR